MSRSYTVILHRAEDGWWVANVPTLHATAQGRTRSGALKRAESLIRFALETIQKKARSLPLKIGLIHDARQPEICQLPVP